MTPITRSKMATQQTEECNSHKNFIFNINCFDGNSENVDWFLAQINDLKKINNWPEDVALLFLKSKLTGPAQIYFANSQSCSGTITFTEACDKLRNFFKKDSTPSSNLAQFQSIQLNPGESIKNLAHRIDTMAHKTYNYVTDVLALNQIKSLQLLNALPHDIRIKIVHENTDDFIKLVDKAHKIHLESSSLHVIQTNCLTSNIPESVQFNELKNQLAELSLKVNDKIENCQFCNNKHSLAHCPSFLQIMSNSSASSNAASGVVSNVNMQQESDVNFSSPNNVLMCMFCHKTGHPMAKCYKYLDYQRNMSCQIYQSNSRRVEGHSNPRSNTNTVENQRSRFSGQRNPLHSHRQNFSQFHRQRYPSRSSYYNSNNLNGNRGH